MQQARGIRFPSRRGPIRQSWICAWFVPLVEPVEHAAVPAVPAVPAWLEASAPSSCTSKNHVHQLLPCCPASRKWGDVYEAAPQGIAGLGRTLTLDQRTRIHPHHQICKGNTEAVVYQLYLVRHVRSLVSSLVVGLLF